MAIPMLAMALLGGLGQGAQSFADARGRKKSRESQDQFREQQLELLQMIADQNNPMPLPGGTMPNDMASPLQSALAPAPALGNSMPNDMAPMAPNDPRRRRLQMALPGMQLPGGF